MKDIYHEPDLMQFHGEVNMLGDRKTWNSYIAVWGDISKDTEDFVRIKVLYSGNNEEQSKYELPRMATRYARKKKILNFRHGLEIASRDDIVNRYKQVCTPKKRRAERVNDNT